MNFQWRPHHSFCIDCLVKESDLTVVCSRGFRRVGENAAETLILFVVLSHSGAGLRWSLGDGI